MTAYPTLDEKFSDAQRDRLSKVNIPVEAIARIQYEVIDLKSQRLFNAPPARSEKIRQIEAFTRALAAFSEACSNLSSETIHIIRAHSFGESPSIKTGNIKTRVSLEEFIAAYRSGSVEALDGLRAAGKARDDEPEIQRKLAMRILRIFEQFGLPSSKGSPSNGNSILAQRVAAREPSFGAVNIAALAVLDRSQWYPVPAVVLTALEEASQRLGWISHAIENIPSWREQVAVALAESERRQALMSQRRAAQLGVQARG